MFAGKPRELARGVLLARIILEHLFEVSSPGAEHLDRGLHNYPCASLKLVSPDVLRREPNSPSNDRTPQLEPPKKP